MTFCLKDKGSQRWYLCPQLPPSLSHSLCGTRLTLSWMVLWARNGLPAQQPARTSACLRRPAGSRSLVLWQWSHKRMTTADTTGTPSEPAALSGATWHSWSSDTRERQNMGCFNLLKFGITIGSRHHAKCMWALEKVTVSQLMLERPWKTKLLISCKHLIGKISRYQGLTICG